MSNINAGSDFKDVPAWDNNTPASGVEMNKQAEALVARTNYLKENAMTPELVVDKGGKRLDAFLAANIGEAHRCAPMAALIKRTSTFSLSNNNPSAAIGWTDRRLDTGLMWSSDNPTRLTVPAGASGIWRFRASVEFPANSTGSREVIIRRGGSTIIKRICVPATSGGRTQVVEVDSGPVAAIQGHYFEVLYFQDSGVTLTGEITHSMFAGERVGDFRGRWEGVYFSADYAYRGNWDKYRAHNGTVIEGSGLSVVPDPVNPSLVAGRIRCTKDNNSVIYPRVQATTGSVIDLDGEVYVGLSIFIPQDTHDRLVAAGHGINIHEIYGPPAGTRSPNLIQYNPSVGLNLNAYIDGQDVRLWTLPPSQCVGKWIDIVHRVKMSTDPAVGFHELWANIGDGNGRVQQTLSDGASSGLRYYLATVVASINGSGKNYSSLKVSWANGSMLEEATIYIGDHRVGTDLFVSTDRADYVAAY